jgi:hypothetical protein
MLVEDIDCSAFATAPEDGQFIVAVSKTGNDGTGETISADDAGATTPGGHGLCMVWGSAQRSDRQARGDARVPVIRKGGGRFRTKCFLHDDDDGTLATNYAEGAPLTVAQPAAASPLQGSADRLLLCPAGANFTGMNGGTHTSADGSGDNCWIVGYVIRVITDSTVSGTGEIEFYLYDQPRLTRVDG